MGVTWALGLDDGLGGDADAAVVEGQLAAGQALRPAVVVELHDRLAARFGPLTHRLAWLDGLVLEVDGADGSIHGTQEEQQVRTAACTCTQHGGSRSVHLPVGPSVQLPVGLTVHLPVGLSVSNCQPSIYLAVLKCWPLVHSKQTRV